MLETIVYDKLSQITEVENTVYPLILESNTTYPAMTYQNISIVPHNSLNDRGIENSRFQIDIYAKTYKEIKDLFLVLESKMQELKSVLLGTQELYDESTTLYRLSIDYSIWQQ